MRFSELSLVKPESGLTYDPETLSLIGEKRGFGVCVSDENDEYTVKIYADITDKYEKIAADAVKAVCEGLPKNAVNGLSVARERVTLRLCRDMFLQEKLSLLLSLTDGLTGALYEANIAGLPAMPPERAAAPEEAPESQRAAYPAFSANSLKGAAGALIGAAAMVFISSAAINLRSSGAVGVLFSDVGSYILPAASALLIHFDYRFLAKRFDTFGAVFCTVISVLCAALSALLAAALAYAGEKGIAVTAALSAFSELYELSPEAASLGERCLIIGALVSAAVSVLCGLAYFNRHPEETLQSGNKK